MCDFELSSYCVITEFECFFMNKKMRHRFVRPKLWLKIRFYVHKTKILMKIMPQFES